MSPIQTTPNMEMFDAYCKMRREVHEFTERKLDEFASLFLSTSHQSFLTVTRNPSSFSEQSVESRTNHTTQNHQKIVIPKPIPNQSSLKKRLEEKEKKSSTAKVTSIHQPSSSTNKRKAESPQRKLIRIPPNPAKVASSSKKIRTESPPQQSKPTSPEPAQNTYSEHTSGKKHETQNQHITKSTPPQTKSSQSSEQEENSATKRKNPFRELEERCLKEQDMFEENENSEDEEEEREESDEEEEKDKEEEEEDDIEEESEMGSDVEVID